MNKFILFLFSLLICFGSISQRNLLMGIEISPSMGMSIQKDRLTGVLSSKNAFGMNGGLSFRWAMTESRILNTGISYEYLKFSESITDSIGSETKLSALNIPLSLGIQMSGGTFFMIGGGAKYNIKSSSIQEGTSVNVRSEANLFQPYASLGLTHDFFIKKGYLEIGVQGRFHFMDVWKNTSSFSIENSNNVMNIDLTLKWFMFGRRYGQLYHFFKIK